MYKDCEVTFDAKTGEFKSKSAFAFNGNIFIDRYMAQMLLVMKREEIRLFFAIMLECKDFTIPFLAAYYADNVFPDSVKGKERSKRSGRRAIVGLKKLGILIPAAKHGLYYINPSLAWSGKMTERHKMTARLKNEIEKVRFDMEAEMYSDKLKEKIKEFEDGL